MKHNVIVYIGRFQPAHLGHIATMKAALEQANRLVVVIGSHNVPRDILNPWTAPERETMIRACLTAEQNARISFVYAENRLYSNTFWARNIEKLVNEEVATFGFIKPTIAIIGNGKGDADTHEYINLFKKWDRVPMQCIDIKGMPLHATKLRELLFTGHVGLIDKAMCPEAYQWLVDFTETDTFATLKSEYEFAINYEKLYENAPFKSTNFYTADSVVIQSGHVLLIKRKNAPGKGLWALPGGHVNQGETAFQASMRELVEETGIKLQPEVLERCMFCEKLFDHPDRSLRARVTRKQARTVDVAFGYKLDDKRDLPSVKGTDDAEDAHWFTFEEVAQMRGELFEDHADIVEYMLARVPE
jgi:bifunctional NMN adenylyltransferase/nudix hydrolase